MISLFILQMLPKPVIVLLMQYMISGVLMSLLFGDSIGEQHPPADRQLFPPNLPDLANNHDCSLLLMNPNSTSCSLNCPLTKHNSSEICRCPDGFSLLGKARKTCIRMTCHSLNQFTCNNGMCIPQTFVCDGKLDCDSHEDELNCKDNYCPELFFNCGRGQCILETWVCDAENDCDTGKDEMNCPDGNSSEPIKAPSTFINTVIKPTTLPATASTNDMNMSKGDHITSKPTAIPTAASTTEAINTNTCRTPPLIVENEFVSVFIVFVVVMLVLVLVVILIGIVFGLLRIPNLFKSGRPWMSQREHDDDAGTSYHKVDSGTGWQALKDSPELTSRMIREQVSEDHRSNIGGTANSCVLELENVHYFENTDNRGLDFVSVEEDELLISPV